MRSKLDRLLVVVVNPQACLLNLPNCRKNLRSRLAEVFGYFLGGILPFFPQPEAGKQVALWPTTTEAEHKLQALCPTTVASR
jgi:hypothetical protein